MADGTSRAEVRYGSDVVAARESYEAEIAALRTERTKLIWDVEYLRSRSSLFEKALLDTRKELLEARAEICALHGDDENEERDQEQEDSDLRSDVRRGY